MDPTSAPLVFWERLITGVAFPIVACIGLAIYTVRANREHAAALREMLASNKSERETTQKEFVEALKEVKTEIVGGIRQAKENGVREIIVALRGRVE